MYRITSLIAIVAIGSLTASAEIINLSTPSTSMILDANVGQPLKTLYYGERLSDKDIENLTSSPLVNHDAYPVYGIYPQGEAALSVTHSDGNRTTQAGITDVTTKEVNGATVTTVAMRDYAYPFDIKVNYRVRPGYDVIETWVDLTNNEKGTVTLNRFMSGYLPIRYGDVWISSLYGSWANEANLTEEPLTHGVKMIKNKDGLILLLEYLG